MKKIIRLLFLCPFLIFLFSCKNPFVESKKTTVILVENEEAEEPDEPEVIEKKITNLKLLLEIHYEDVILNASKSGNTISLSTKEEYDAYEWYLGNQKISGKKECSLNLNGFAQNEYPVVLYARKNTIVYSAVYYVNFDGSAIVESNARTILPDYANSKFTEINVSILNINSEENCENQEGTVKQYENYNALVNDILLLEYGEYQIQINAKVGGVCFSGEIAAVLSDDDECLTIDMKPQIVTDEENGAGSLDFKVYFVTDLQLSKAAYTLYKKVDNHFEYVYSANSDDGNLLFYKGTNEYEGFAYIHEKFDNLKAGTYWLRINGYASDGRKACHQVEYVYIEDGVTSSKTIEIFDFYDLYNIRYVFNQGFCVEDNLMTQYSSFDVVSLPSKQSMFKYGYDFTGWYEDELLTKKAKDTSLAGMYSGDKIFYAGWKQNDAVEEDSGKLVYLDDCDFMVEETEESICVKIPYSTKSINLLESEADLFIISVYDKNNNLMDMNSSSIVKCYNGISVVLGSKLRKKEFYMIKVEVYNTVNNIEGIARKQKVFSGKQIVQPFYNHNI